MLQLQHIPPPQSTTPGLHPVSIHQMAPPVRWNKHPITAYYSVCRPRKYERLSRPWWLVTYRNKVPPTGVEPGHVTHPSTNWARRRVTSLIRPTLFPLRHAAVFPLDISKPVQLARITELDKEMFRHEFWKLTYFDIKRSNVKAASHKNFAVVGLCILVSAGF